MEDRILIYDTTLRDGTQGEDINFSLHGKIRIAKELDRLGVQFIEGGWIPSNPKDDSFFQKISTPELENSSIIACGSTRRPGREAEEDSSLKALV
ncbi:MAG: citramalate synthase, partial [Candidatus Bipolaricaulota bacterium]